MKKMIVLLTMLLCIASSCFAAEERSTKDIFADTTIANVVITGDQLRVRTHPDLDGYIIKKLDKGTVCKFMNKVDDKIKWMTRTERIPGFISSWKTEPSAGSLAPMPASRVT